MRSLSHPWILTLTLLGLIAFSPLRATAQQSPQPRPIAPAHGGDINTPNDEDEARARILKDMEKKANKDRFVALKSDTDKLLKLSVELKSSVDKSDENVLSLDVVKKADEIEKLAKSIKDKMKGPN